MTPPYKTRTQMVMENLRGRILRGEFPAGAPLRQDALAKELAVSRIPVREAAEKEPILPNTAYIAPPNYHLLVEADRTFSFASTEKVNYARPSVDMLFITAAETYQSHLIGVILTGANSDGSHGLKIIKEYGGLTIVQNPATAEAASMPEAALKATSVDYILSLEDIGHLLNQITREKSAN